jgi:hypothetical protein
MRNPPGFDYKESSRDALAGIYERLRSRASDR